MDATEAILWFEKADFWSIRNRSAILGFWSPAHIDVRVKRQRGESLHSMIVRCALLAKECYEMNPTQRDQLEFLALPCDRTKH